MLIGGLVGLAQELPFPGQQFVQTRCGKIGDTGEDVGEPGLGIDVVETASRDRRQHDGGPVGSALRAGEGPIAPSQSSRTVILPIVVQKSKSIIRGIRCTGDG